MSKISSALAADEELRELSQRWIEIAARHRYHRQFQWLGLPVIQIPQDLIALQELVWHVRPRFIVETGVFLGGSVVFYASLLELLGGHGNVIGIDRGSARKFARP